MSSTTSSDCESCDCSQCTYSFENNHNDYTKLMSNSPHVPIYATMAHPLIYYAEVQQPKNRRQANDQPRKDNPFKKAFKWYTQERCRLVSNKTEVCPERSGFANWLDNKYDEYLRESEQPMKPASKTNEPRTPKDFIAEPEPCPGASRKYRRLKSPWSKRRRSANDGGDVPVNRGPCGSCEYILKPKDMMRATSEHTPTSGGKSNATVTSSNVPCNMKCSGRSHSLSDVGRERSVPRHGDTVTYIAQGSRAQEQDLTKKPTVSCMCHQEQVVQVPSKKQEPAVVHCKCPHCLCPPEKEPEVVKIPEVVKVPSKKQVEPCCQCLREKEHEVIKTPEVVKVSSKKEIDPCCPCHQEKVPQVKKLPSKTKPPVPPPEKLPEVVKESSIKIDPTRLPYCPCPQDKVPQVEKLPSKTKPVPPPEKLPEVVKEPSIKIDPMRLPYCPCPQDKVPQVEKLPSKTQDPTYPPYTSQKNLPEVVKVPTKAQEPKNQPVQQQETVSEIVKVPSKAQEPKIQPVAQPEKVPSKGQESTDKPQPCCKCNLKKKPEIVQVPSRSRAVQESCQVPEDKVVPVNEGTQYEPALRVPRSTQNVRPCCCNTCNPPFPAPPPIICLPVKVQSSKISTPETCLITPSAISDATKKQKKATQRRSVSCQFDEGNKSKVDNQCQHQNETCTCSKPCCSNCHSVNLVCDPIPIRRQSYSPVTLSEERAVKEVALVNKFTRSVTCASNDAAQTSDHSICFDKDGVCSCQCPLFLKIIYADIKE